MRTKDWALFSLSIGLIFVTLYIFMHHTADKIHAHEPRNTFSFKILVIHDSMNCKFSKTPKKIALTPYHVLIDKDGQISTTVYFRDNTFCEHTSIRGINRNSLGICFETTDGHITQEQKQSWLALSKKLLEKEHIEKRQFLMHSKIDNCRCAKQFEDFITSSLN